MAFVVTAVVGSAVIGGVSSYLTGKKANKALARGAAAQERSAMAGIEEQGRQYDQTREDFAPWREMGEGAIGRMESAMGGDMSGFNTSAGYNFVRNEGMRDTENRFSVGGGGGNAMRALAEFNSGLASTEYGNWFNRNLSMSGQGMGATQGTAAAGANAANNISGAYNNLGQGQLNTGVNQANNAWGVGAGINNALQGGISNYLYGQRTNLYDDMWKDRNPVGTPPWNPAENNADINWDDFKG